MSKIYRLDSIVYAKKELKELEEKIKVLDLTLKPLYNIIGDGKIWNIITKIEDIIVQFEMRKYELELRIKDGDSEE
jgi:hypothetical protein